jgi:hypothetical protein
VKKKGEGERLTSGARLSVRAGKRKERESTRAGAGSGLVGCWAAWAERVAGVGFVFFFPNFIFKSFFNSNSNQTFANFSQEFYRLFRDHTSNQKPCKPNDDAHTLVVSKFINLSLIFLELNLISNLISLNP